MKKANIACSVFFCIMVIIVRRTSKGWAADKQSIGDEQGNCCLHISISCFFMICKSAAASFLRSPSVPAVSMHTG